MYCSWNMKECYSVELTQCKTKIILQILSLNWCNCFNIRYNDLNEPKYNWGRMDELTFEKRERFGTGTNFLTHSCTRNLFLNDMYAKYGFFGLLKVCGFFRKCSFAWTFIKYNYACMIIFSKLLTHPRSNVKWPTPKNVFLQINVLL